MRCYDSRIIRMKRMKTDAHIMYGFLNKTRETPFRGKQTVSVSTSVLADGLMRERLALVSRPRGTLHVG